MIALFSTLRVEAQGLRPSQDVLGLGAATRGEERGRRMEELLCRYVGCGRGWVLDISLDEKGGIIYL